jgi:CDP-glucose 4,6-dehydratase
MVTRRDDSLESLGTLRGRTVLVTGHSGFIGSWLCTLLVAAGAYVVGYSLSEDRASRARLEYSCRLTGS